MAQPCELPLVCVKVFWHEIMRALKYVQHNVAPYVVEAPAVVNDNLHIFAAGIPDTFGGVTHVLPATDAVAALDGNNIIGKAQQTVNFVAGLRAYLACKLFDQALKTYEIREACTSYPQHIVHAFYHFDSLLLVRRS
ncbi:hypothetical protein RRF57_011780 [Xylaria bambusicola]|uniref:Uncharacterized protein n=1 Tax=Xylaria bambusicola TaxID=326684 RepID=A0AAN7ZE97_9PEZI